MKRPTVKTLAELIKRDGHTSLVYWERQYAAATNDYRRAKALASLAEEAIAIIKRPR